MGVRMFHGIFSYDPYGHLFDWKVMGYFGYI